MPARPDPKDFHHSLLAGDAAAAAAARQAVLERMRSKLAAPSQASLAHAERRRRAAVRKAVSWGWRIALAAAFLGGNAYLIGVAGSRPAAAAAQVRKAPAVAVPVNLALNDQALYWTYALYDFDRLRAKYGAPADAVVDASEARRRLEDLLPRVDEPTRFMIRQYLPKPGSRA